MDSRFDKSDHIGSNKIILDSFIGEDTHKNLVFSGQTTNRGGGTPDSWATIF